MRSYTQDLDQSSNQRRSPLVAAIIAVVCLFSLASVTTAAAATDSSDGEVLTFTRADLNGDGAVNFEDLILGMQYFKGHGQLAVIEALDVINDGQINESDLYGLEHIASAPRGSGFLPERMQIHRGDLNDDGQIDATDARILEAYLESNGRIRDTALDAADLDKNGVINSRDMALLDNMVRSAEEEKPADSQQDPKSKRYDVGLTDSGGEAPEPVEGPDFSGVSERDAGSKVATKKGSDGGRNPRVIDYLPPSDDDGPTFGGAPTRSDKGSASKSSVRFGYAPVSRQRSVPGDGANKGETKSDTSGPELGSNPRPRTRRDAGTKSGPVKGVGIGGHEQPRTRTRTTFGSADSDEQAKDVRKALSAKKSAAKSKKSDTKESAKRSRK
jgi:hypothetical protein